MEELKDYSADWSSSLLGFSNGQLTNSEGDLPSVVLQPITTLETENYYFICTHEDHVLNSTGVPEGIIRHIASVHKKTGKIIGRNVIIPSTDIFFIHGDSLLICHSVTRFTMSSTQTFKWTRIDSDMTIIEVYESVDNPLYEFYNNRNSEYYVSARFDELGSFHMNINMVNRSGVDKSEILSGAFHVSSHGSILSDKITKKTVDRDNNFDVTISKHGKMYGSSSFGIIEQLPSGRSNKPNHAVSDSYVLWRENSSELYLGPAESKISIESRQATIDSQTTLTKKPRNAEHENVKGQFGLVVDSTLFSVDHKGSVRTSVITTEENSVHRLVAVDSKGAMYEFDGRRLKKYVNGTIVWVNQINDYGRQIVVDYRFVEDQDYLILILSFLSSSNYGSSTIYCFDNSSGETLWDSATLSNSSVRYRPRSQQLPTVNLSNFYVMLDLKAGESEEVQAFFVANINRLASAERIHFEMTSPGFSVHTKCRRIPAKPKYLAI